MKITIEFSTDNAAFEDGYFLPEIGDVILTNAYNSIHDNQHQYLDWEEKIHDSNGNTVGTVRGEGAQ